MRALVVIGTDGVRDYIKFADGRTFTLGSVSVLKLVTEAVSSGYECRKILNQFLKQGEAPALVDLDVVERLCQKPRARWSSTDKPFVFDLDQTPLNKDSSMKDVEAANLDRQLDAIERHLAILAKRNAKTASVGEESIAKEVVFSSLVAHVEDLAKLKTAAECNEEVADRVMKTVQATFDLVAKAESQGLPVDGTLVRADLYKIASSLTSMLDVEDTSLVDHDGLMGLSMQADRIHGYFE